MDANSIRISCAEEMHYHLKQIDGGLWLLHNGGAHVGFPKSNPSFCWKYYSPNYCEDLNAALSLLEAIRRDHLITITEDSESWLVRAETEDGGLFFGTNPNLCAAIAELFLKVRGRYESIS